MDRDIDSLTNRSFDVLVIGGGAVGAWTTLEAARGDRSVALVERGDFGAGASSSTLKILHAGFRYLGTLDVRRFFRSRRSVEDWRRLSPGLVAPLPVVVPATGRGLSRKLVFRAAAGLEATLGAVNRLTGRHASISRARTMTPEEVHRTVPPLAPLSSSGGLLFYDALMYNTERLLMVALKSAATRGATLSNYCEATTLSRSNGCYTVECIDRLEGRSFAVRARSVVNATGVDAGATLASLAPSAETPIVGRVRGVNVVMEDLGFSAAFAVPTPSDRASLPGSRRERHLFVVPWRGRTLLGTAYGLEGSGDPATSDEALGHALLAEIQAALPDLAVNARRVLARDAGWLPLAASGATLRVPEAPILENHAPEGWPGLVTAVTEKFTTAPWLARKALGEIDRSPFSSRRGSTIDEEAGPDADPEASRSPGSPSVPTQPSRADQAHFGELAPDVREHLSRLYGAEAPALARYRRDDPNWNRRLVDGEPSIRAQVHHAVWEELAVTPDDVVSRRLELGSRGLSERNASDLARELLAELDSKRSPPANGDRAET